MPLSVDKDKLRALLARGSESDDLDYKLMWDPSVKGELIEVCKDVAAMESLASGGYIVIGADDFGIHDGTFAPSQPADFDEQRIRSKVASVLGEPIDLSVAFHLVDDLAYVVLGVGPHRDGMRIMPKDGEYADTTVWRAADIFVRRGTSSARWNQHEARGVIDRVVAARKEEWRADILDTLRNTTPVFDPGGLIDVNVDLPLGAFVSAVIELIRRQDEVGIDLLARKVVGKALSIVKSASMPGQDGGASAAELSDQLDRLDSMAALSARYSVPSAFEKAMTGYRDIYGAVDESYQYEQPRTFPLGHKEVLIHLYAVGAVLVYDKKWEPLGSLATLVPENTGKGYWTSLLRKAEVMTARAELLTDENGTRVGVIESAKSGTGRLLARLDPGRPIDVTNLLVEFDVYRGIANGGTDEDDKLGAYTNFAFYYSSRAEPAFLRVLDDDGLRAAIFDGTDEQLAAVYRNMSKVAFREAFAYNGWDGFEDPRLVKFSAS